MLLFVSQDIVSINKFWILELMVSQKISDVAAKIY
jgi:hypothetical protein